MSADRFNLDALASRLSARGVASFVTMTGGGVATLYGGEALGSDSDEGARHVVAIGPGTYGYGSHPSYGWWEELVIGPDDDGSGDYVVWEGPRDIDAVVDYVVAHMDEYRASVVEFLGGTS